MMRFKQLEPRFVKSIPRELELGVLYVSMEYGTVVHGCCCGCGNEVVTPLTPTDWSLTFNGEAISLWPSVGNWNLPCQSHYVIRSNKVIEAGAWNKAKIEAEQRRDKKGKAEFYAQVDRQPDKSPAPLIAAAPAVQERHAEKSIWEKLCRWLVR
ncbi:hypothetical protein A6V36_01795 [Paraburkholderia ginsengiterrae]|uniref:Uncharacterized protein n=1 Tax=Paraburkholderia ginsengiterrae TaxID=1462993 RepID=A0A1A9NDA7_9BURK|nr:DUF6527 family protein [Paraburkholderia ginsengiterrae]OAJ60551.1 hypothetical protein A6V36_01795 [Paraburkholderia ginsengiterrae]OAJ64104.1 hypothetical protein A6V37_00990 [Paraburkholderia ginsengiterrae]